MAPTVTADHLNPQTWSDDQIWEALARRLGHDRRLGVAPGTHRRPQRAADAQLVNEPMLYGRLFLAGEGLTPRRVRRVDPMCSTQVPACPAQTGCTCPRGRTRGGAAARIGLGVVRFRFSLPKVDYLGSPAVGWETEL